MARYFFNFVNPGAPVIDHEGVEAAGDEFVCAEALEIVATVRSDPDQKAAWAGWTIEIVAGCGRPVASIPFDVTIH